jgi:pimeloyl-ACP methyl ester carboxylesterase
VALAALLPPAGSLEGWSLAEGPLTFRPDSLYEYLDGGAPRYLDYGFREAVHVRYAFGGDPLAAVTLDVYDMGSTLGAFGIYSSARPLEVAPRSWGAEGYRSETVAAAWKGRVYVHVEADDERPALVGMAERLVESVAERTEGETASPAILRPLPPEGRVPRSERYVARDLLGHAFLPGGVLARYALDGREAEMFFSELRDAPEAAAAAARFRAHYALRGTIVREAPAVGAGVFDYEDPVWGSGTVAVAGRFVAGVYGELSGEARRSLLGDLVAGLLPPAPPADPATGSYAEVGGVKLYYEIHGRGEPLLLLHGGLGSTRDFLPIVPGLAAHYRVILYDRAGHGRSQDSLRPFAYDAMAREAVGFLDAIRVDTAAVVGFSDGGVVGYHLASAHPARVKALVASGANHLVQGMDEAAVAWIRTRLNERGIAEDYPEVKALYEQESPGGGSLASFLARTRELWLRDPYIAAGKLRAIKAPVLLVAGDRNDIRLDHILEIRSLIAGSQLSIVPNCDHFVIQKKPELFTAVVLDFLAGR